MEPVSACGEVLNFIFSSFWIWLGTVWLLVVIFYGLSSVIAAMTGGRRR